MSWFSHIRKPTSRLCDRVKFPIRIKTSKKIFLSKETDPYGTTEAGKLKTWTRLTKSAKKPIQSTFNLLDWLIFLLHEKHILLAKTSYHGLRNGFKVSMGAVNTKNKAIYLTWDQTIFFAFARFSKRPYNTKWEWMKRSTRWTFNTMKVKASKSMYRCKLLTGLF